MRLLMATGGAKHSELALRLGAQIAPRIGEPPTILTVIRRPEDRRRAEAPLARARELLQGAIPDVRTTIRVGHPAEEIVGEARRGKYDLLLIGERPKHSLATRFLGSTVAHVVEHAPCPVIIAKGRIGPIHHILLCDSGAHSESLLNHFTAQLSDLAEGEVVITVLHVMSQMGAGPGASMRGRQLRASAEELIGEHTPEGVLLERDVRILERPHVHAVPKIRHGLVVEEILAEAQSGNYDLIVIGAHRGARWQRLLLDDIAHQIIAHADRPVLVLS